MTDISELENNAIAYEVIEEPLETQLETAYAVYAFYTIQDRALPNILDGLKPVQRRILYSMHETGLLPTKNHTKSSRVVGDVMGKYHPHGDASIYDALVRLAQNFTFPCPPIDGQGNFGIPGVSAASSRYTESRLSHFGELMTKELDDNIIETKLNYDDSLQEPLALPTQIPTLLINGQSGIAVALACSFGPHNPREAVRAALYQLEHQELWTAIANADSDETKQEAIDNAVNELIKVIPGPDFPTGGKIIGVEGAHEAYRTGFGKILNRGSYIIEPLGRGKHKIVFTSFPYNTSPSGIVKYLKDNEEKFLKSERILKENGGKGKSEGFQIAGITAIDDFGDARNPQQLVIQVDSKTNPEVVVAELFKKTALESSFNFNQNCLINGVPSIVTLPDMLQHFLNFRRDLVKKRAEREVQRAMKRLEVVNGLLTILVDIDKAIAIIRESDTPESAAEGLMQHFDINEEQSQSILSTALRRLTRLDSLALEKERETLNARIEQQNTIVNDKKVRDEVVRNELNRILTDFENNPLTERRSTIDGVSLKDYAAQQKQALSQSREVKDEPIDLYLTRDYTITSEPDQYALNKISSTTLGMVTVLTSKGRGLRIPVQDVSILPLDSNERIVTIADNTTPLVIGTKKGLVYSFQPSFPRANEFTYMQLNDDDEVIAGYPVSDEDELVFVASDSSLLHYPASTVAVKASINGKGMAGMKLGENQSVIAFKTLNKKEQVLAKVATSTGTSVKLSPFSEYPSKGRGTGGVKSHRFLKGEESLTQADIGLNPQFLAGEELFVPEDGRRDGSGEKFVADSIRSTFIPA